MSAGCQERVTVNKLTGRIVIGIAGCKFDRVRVPLFNLKVHKEVIGVIVIGLDAFSIVIMIYFFSVLRQINMEYLDIMDDLRVQMKDFGIKIDEVILDRYTQDSRLIKMKVWLHFTKILGLEEISGQKADEYNDLEVIDVTLSNYTQPSIQLVFRMQEIQLAMDEINLKLHTN